MRRPLPRRMAISFVRFVPALPPAQPRAARLSLVRPRDPVTLSCLLAAAALAVWALLDATRDHAAARPGHVGLRVVLDVSHSMTVGAGSRPRFEIALDRLDAARAVLREAGAHSTCIEIVRVASVADAAHAVPLTGDLPDASVAPPLAEGGDPARLVEAAVAEQGQCPLTQVLILTDLGPSPVPDTASWPVLWDQVGDPVGNAGLRMVSLTRTAFGTTAPELRIEGINSDAPVPRVVVIDGPGGRIEAPAYPMPEAAGRWYALAPYGGAGVHDVRLVAGDGYSGDDWLQARIEAPPQVAVDWRIGDLPRPAALAAGGDGDLLVARLGDPAAASGLRPALLVHDGFGGQSGTGQIGVFVDDPALLGSLSFDALELAMPAPIPGALPDGFQPVMTDTGGLSIIARRPAGSGQSAAIIVPAPAPAAPEPQRSLSLTLFFSALADLAAMPAREEQVLWLAPDSTEVPGAWRESLTGRPAGAPADLALLVVAAPASERTAVWPWYLLAALAAILAERSIRAWRAARRGGVTP